MALQVAQLPNMPGLDIPRQTPSNDNRIRDLVLAQLATQLGTAVMGTAGNALTHATGSDQTQNAMDAGLIPSEDRNWAQRFFGDQMSTQEFDELKRSKAAQDASVAATHASRVGATLDVNRAKQDRYESALRRTDSANREFRELNSDYDAEARRQNDQQLAELEMKRRFLADQVNSQREQNQFDQSMRVAIGKQNQDATQYATEQPVRDAETQFNIARAAALNRETRTADLQENSLADMRMQKFIEEQIEQVYPDANAEQKASAAYQLQSYGKIAKDNTPTFAERSAWLPGYEAEQMGNAMAMAKQPLGQSRTAEQSPYAWSQGVNDSQLMPEQIKPQAAQQPQAQQSSHPSQSIFDELRAQQSAKQIPAQGPNLDDGVLGALNRFVFETPEAKATRLQEELAHVESMIQSGSGSTADWMKRRERIVMELNQ